MKPTGPVFLAQAASTMLLVAFVLSGSTGCDTVPGYGTASFACGAIAPCAEGFVCDLKTTLCVPTSGPCSAIAPCAEGFVCDSKTTLCVPTSGPCTVDKDCALDEVCAATNLCEQLVEDLQCGTVLGSQKEDALRLGFMMTLSGPYAESGLEQRKVLELALSEINTNGGIQGRQDQRELAFVVCDTKGEEDYTLASVHYFDQLGIPAILGPGFSSLLKPAATEVAIPKGIFMVSPSSTAVDIRDLEDDDLIWRISSTDTEQANTLAYFAFWLAQEPIHDGDPVSILVAGVHTKDNYGLGFREGFENALLAFTVVLKGLVDVQFKAVPHSSKGEVDDWDAEVKDVIDALKTEKPHIVLFVGYEDTADILSQMKVEPTLNTLPVLLTDGVSSKALATTYQPGDVKPEHIFGVQPGFRTGAAYEHFKALFARASLGEAVPPAWTEHTYDGVYLLAYAAAGIDPEAVSGAAFAEAFKRFDEPGGRIVNVGPDHLLVACQDMGEGKGIDVRGASGPLDFDPDTGEPMSVGILRWTVDFPNPEEPGQLADCGLAMVHDANASGPQTYWCGARCLTPPSDNPPCEAGYCLEEGTVCANNVCTGGDDCKPEHAP